MNDYSTATIEIARPEGRVEVGPKEQKPIHGLGAIALAGLFGGPIAIGYLVWRNFSALYLKERRGRAIVFLVLFTAFWFYVALHVPPDLMSQLIPLLPQLAIWWLAARYFLARAHARHKAGGGKFRSLWIAIGVGVLVNIIFKAALYVLGLF